MSEENNDINEIYDDDYYMYDENENDLGKIVVSNEIEFLDTAGEDDYQNMMDMWISFGDGFLIVFAINDRESFELTKGKRERVIKGKYGSPIILVGNKKELENEREVSYNEAKSLADSWGIGYIETCSKLNVNCKEVFENLSKKIIKYKANNKSSKKCIII